MRNRRGMAGILLAAVIVLCWGNRVYASVNWAGLSAVLTADQKSVTRTNSAGDPFLTTAMYAHTQGNSAHSIMFHARGGSSVGNYTLQEALITVQPGDAKTVNISSAFAYHSLTLTGKDGLETVKGCIGEGWLEKN
ncbi:MAG: hypothetical protein K2N24_10100 [Lachnospiraceae bacterium]|nr:hypothetical protein [Lachnospiraceae bacterium]